MNSLPPTFTSAVFNKSAFSGGAYLTKKDADRLYLSITYENPYINYLVGVTPGTATASKVLIVDSSLNIVNINSLTATNLTGTLQTAAQANITSLGTLTALNVNGLTLLGDLTSTNGRARLASSAGIMYLQTSINTTTDNGCDFAIGNYTQTASTSSRVFMIKSTGLTGIQSYNPIKQLSINSATGDCLRLIYNNKAGTETNYCDMLVSSSGNLSITPSGSDVDITTHNGTSVGLKLGGTLVAATATQLSYTAVTPGTATASKALVVDSNIRLNQINVNGEIRVGDLASTAGRFQFLGYGSAGYIQPSTSTSTGNAADLYVTNYGQDITASSRKFCIKADGKLGIQSTSPQKQLSVNSSTGDCLRLIYNDTSGAETVYSDFNQASGGNLTITTTNTLQQSSYLRCLRGLLIDSSLGAGSIQMRTDDVATEQQEISFNNNYAGAYSKVASIHMFIGADNYKSNIVWKTQNTNSAGSYKENMRLTSVGNLRLPNGYLRIGSSTDPGYPLDISTSVSYSIGVGTPYGYYESGGYGNTVGPYTFNTSIRSAASILVSSGGFETVSDRRIKENIEDFSLEIATNFIKNVNSKTFNMKENKNPTLGYIAQDCLKNCNLVVMARPNDDIKGSELEDEPEGIQFSVDYSKVSVLHHCVIQNLLERIEKLEKLLKN